MKIACTVSEFAMIVRGCQVLMNKMRCTDCPLYEVCSDGSIEQFVSAKDIFDDHAEEQ